MMNRMDHQVQYQNYLIIIKNVVVISLCKGDKPHAIHVSSDRILAFKESCRLLNAQPIIFDQSDCNMDYSETLETIEKC